MSQRRQAMRGFVAKYGFIVLCLVTVGCSGSGNSSGTTTTTSPSCVASTVAASVPQGTTSPLQIGQLIQFGATETCTNNTTQALATTDVTWMTSNSTVIAVSSSGLATAVGAGSAKVSFAYQGVQSPALGFTVEAGCQSSTALSGTWVGTDSTGTVEKWELSSCGTAFAGTILSASLSSTIAGVINGSSISFSGAETGASASGAACTGTLTGQGTFTSNTLTVQYNTSGLTTSGIGCGNPSVAVTLAQQ